MYTKRKVVIFMLEMKMYFSDLVDSRDNRGLRHTLVDIVVMSIYAVLCGYTDAENMAFFMKLQEPYFSKMLDLKYGVPSADTLLRVFAIIEPEKFMQMFYQWIRDVLSAIQKNNESELQHIAIDGKAVRAAAVKGGNIPYIISAYLENYGLSIGQLKVGEKTNEIKEIPKLLKELDITDCVITIDAIGCQKQIAKQIIDQKGHYCLAVKTNQAILYEEIKEYFSYAEKEEAKKLSTYETLEKNHGRIEKRKYWISSDIGYLTGKEKWKNLKTIGKVESIREMDEKRSFETRYYILDQEMTAEEMSRIVRGHWGIENNLHWVLDVHFREDACKIKAEKAMQNLSLIRKICYNLMKLDKRFDKKKKMTYKKMSMLYTYHLEYVQELIFEKIVENI